MTIPAERTPRRDQLPAFVTDLLQGRENVERSFEGKVALVTGANRDIGGGIALAFALRGASIVGIHRDPGKDLRSRPVIGAVQSCNVPSEFLVGDITNPGDRVRLRQTIKQSFHGQLDFLVLSASGSTRELNTEANNALATEFLPFMKERGKIFLLQSTPSHFSRKIKSSDLMPEVYDAVADTKYEGEQTLLARVEELDEHGVSLVIVCAPLVPETWNTTMFIRKDTAFQEKNAGLSDALGIPRTVTIKEIGEKVAGLAMRTDLQSGYVELFGDGVYDAKSILRQWYGDEAIFIDTYSPKEKTARTMVTKDFCKGHFKGLEVCPAHILGEAGSQAAGLLALAQLNDGDIIPMTQRVTVDLKAGKPVKPGDAITFRLTELEWTKHGFNAITTMFHGHEYVGIVEPNVLLVKRKIAERILK